MMWILELEIRGVASRRRWLRQQHVAVHERMLLPMEAAQTMQQFANLLGEFNRVSGAQRQPAPATPVHQGKDQPVTEGAGGDWDEEQRKSADRVHWLPAPAGRNQRVLAASVVDPSLFPKNGTGDGDGGE